MFIEYAQAQIITNGPHVTYAMSVVDRIKQVILYPLISLLFGIAFLVFLWGVFQMVSKATSEEARTTGKRHMLFGIIGMIIMLSAYAILKIATNTVGVYDGTLLR